MRKIPALMTVAALLFALPACTTIVLDDSGTQSFVSVGVTRIIVPQSNGDLIAFRRTGVGLGFENAVGNAAWLGFDESEWVIADPKSCQMLVVIRSNTEADQAASVLEKMEGENVCYVNDTQP